MTTGHDHNAHAAHTTAPGGVLIADAGLRLVLGDTINTAGSRTVEVTIVDDAGVPVTDYLEQHDKELHLIAVRRDLEGFQHVHPVRDAAGVWRTNLDLTAGAWRILADFTAASTGRGVTLGADLLVSGQFTPEPLPAASSTVEVDGYTVTLDGGLSPQEGRTLTFHVEHDGAPVTDLEPYLAAYGHLVALRSGDLAYLHVHPEAGTQLTFRATAPSAGDYRLFLDFKHNGAVRTAEFTATAETPAHHGHHHHH
ncbi:MAG: hypothetical protein LBE07_07420 [Gordonia sp. (in: high G+C Gram-positive bacteria)]|jgi:hypothetical protein|nr:hypothetical protein [Gordonia sp. (in: high G+C Gram-positive bacteria)]